jgi:hypothetical protein
MNSPNLRFPRRAARLLAAAGLAGAMIAAGAGFSSAIAQTAAPPPGHEMLAQHMARHLQEHLDKLAARLEIKASQEPAWQAFAAAFRDLAGSRPMMGRDGARASDEDAATIARERADRAADHAQKMARLADATAKLEQSLGPDQRQVFNETARRFAHEHMEPGAGDGERGHWGGHDHGGPHCEEHGPWHHGGEDGPRSESEPAGPAVGDSGNPQAGGTATR